MFFFKLQGRQKEEVRGVPDFLQRLELHRSVCVGGSLCQEPGQPCPLSFPELCLFKLLFFSHAQFIPLQNRESHMAICK